MQRSQLGFLTLLAAAVPLWAGGAEAGIQQSSGTRRMAERLEQWTRGPGQRNPFANAVELKRLQKQVAEGAAPAMDVHWNLANELLNFGQPEEALAVLTNFSRRVSAAGGSLGPRNRRDLRILEGLAYLRLGELENCVHHHNPDSCLLPIRGGGEHHARRGSENAEAIFLQLARQKTNDLGARWLANIAAMTLGKYPEAVPTDVRIPQRVFESDAPFPRFPEIATQVGLGVNSLSGGVITEDFDGDGLLDVMLSDWIPPGQCRLFKNLGNGKFDDVTEKAGLFGLTGGLNIMQTDYNNDGWPDVYIVRGAWLGELGLMPDSLLKNNGNGTFDDVTEEAGLLSFHPALSAVWFDANNDGWIDLFVGNESREIQFSHPCQLFLNNRNGTFTECATNAGVALEKFVRGVTAGDFDNDGWPDLYISVLGGTNVLFRNAGPAATNRAPGIQFSDVTARAGVGEPLMSFPTWFWDYDNDGWLDIFACGYGADLGTYFVSSAGHAVLGEVVADKLGRPSKAEKARLFRNNHDGTFTDMTRAANLDHVLLAMGANFGDLDNDGFLDFYLGTGAPNFGSLLPNEMFRNDGGRRFQNVTTAGGFGHLQKGHGVAFADLNNDGHQEVTINVGGAFPGDNFFDALFANPGNTNRWLFLKLAGASSNRAAIGARIKVVASTAGKEREVHRVVGSGGSFGSSPLRQEIGLGAADRIRRVEIWWPRSGKTNIYEGLDLNRAYEVSEGVPGPTLRPLKTFSFATVTAKAE